MIRRLAVLALLLASLCTLSSPKVHTFEAAGGRGWVRIWGNGEFHLEGKGSLLIENIGQLRVDLKGTWGEKEDRADGVFYTHFEGTADIVGRGAHVEVRGWNLNAKFVGQGKAWVKGEGTWGLDGEKGAWNPDKWKKLHFRD